jgi:hypothetical protein
MPLKIIHRSNNTKGHIVRTLAAVIKMLWSGECKYISSKHLKSVIGEQEHLFCGFDQQVRALNFKYINFDTN